MSIEDFIITVFCLIDDELKKIIGEHGLRTRGFEPKLSDSEVITVTPANIDERESLWDIIGNIRGLLIADKGLIGEDYQAQIRAHTNVNLQTPLRSNMNDPRGKNFSRWLTSTRRLVETVIGQLSQQFHIEKVRARDLWHLTNRIGRKVLAHTVGIMVNKILGNPSLQFERLEIV